jgi:outer membrane protein OmpA-like peptidoglycan-associated protein
MIKTIVLLSVIALLTTSCTKKVIVFDIIEPVKPPVTILDTLTVIQDTDKITKKPIEIQNPAKKSMVVQFKRNSFELSVDECSKIIDYINSEAPKRLYLVGGCCELGEYEYNRELGYKRAIAVKEYILSMTKVDYIAVESVGEYSPISYAEIWKNRRCEVTQK